MKIDKAVFIGICEDLFGILVEHELEIDEAYLRASGDPFDVKIRARLDEAKAGGISADLQVQWRPEPDVKINRKTIINPGGARQGSFQFSWQKPEPKPRDRRGPVGRPPRFKPLGG